MEDVHAKVRKWSNNMLPDLIKDLQEFHDRHLQDLEQIVQNGIQLQYCMSKDKSYIITSLYYTFQSMLI